MDRRMSGARHGGPSDLPGRPCLAPPVGFVHLQPHPGRHPIYTVYLVCLSMEVNTLGVFLVSVFDHNSK